MGEGHLMSRKSISSLFILILINSIILSGCTGTKNVEKTNAQTSPQTTQNSDTLPQSEKPQYTSSVEYKNILQSCMNVDLTNAINTFKKNSMDCITYDVKNDVNGVYKQLRLNTAKSTSEVNKRLQLIYDIRIPSGIGLEKQNQAFIDSAKHIASSLDAINKIVNDKGSLKEWSDSNDTLNQGMDSLRKAAMTCWNLTTNKNWTTDGEDTAKNASSKVENGNNLAEDTVIDSNSNELTNSKISKEKGLEIVISKAKIEVGLNIFYDSARKINGKIYYLYSVNDANYTLDTYAYCVDVDSGNLFKWSYDKPLSPIQ